MKKILTFIFFIPIITFTAALKPIEPEDTLDPDEINQIHRQKNYFLNKNIDLTSPIWKQTNRKYGRHFLGNRDYFLNLDETIYHILTAGFPIQQSFESLFLSKMQVHSQVGGVIPRINILFGEGQLGFNAGKIFSGLFGFLVPSQWMKIANQKRVYKTSQYLLLIKILDEIKNAKIAYIDQHQLIQEFEIINFYFIHLQMLSKIIPEYDEVNKLLMGKFSVTGTSMATKRGQTKIGFDNLALLIALEKDHKSKGASFFNIEDLKNFPVEVEDPDRQPEILRTKDDFINAVVERSVEFKVAKEFVKISRLNIGITALGDSLVSASGTQGIPENEARFAFKFGYDSIPNILISKAQKNTAVINMRQEYLNMLDSGRRSYDLYTNSLGGYTEAKRSLEMNRQLFYDKLTKILFQGQKVDTGFLLALDYLMESELLLNNALHGFLRAKANIDRFLVKDHEYYLQALPKKEKVEQIYDKLKAQHYDGEEKIRHIDQLIKDLYKEKKLTDFLNSYDKKESNYLYEEKDIIEAVERNIASLLTSPSSFFKKKKKKFFQTLYRFVQEKSISLSPTDHQSLEEKASR